MGDVNRSHANCPRPLGLAISSGRRSTRSLCLIVLSLCCCMCALANTADVVVVVGVDAFEAS